MNASFAFAGMPEFIVSYEGMPRDARAWSGSRRLQADRAERAARPPRLAGEYTGRPTSPEARRVDHAEIARVDPPLPAAPALSPPSSLLVAAACLAALAVPGRRRARRPRRPAPTSTPRRPRSAPSSNAAAVARVIPPKILYGIAFQESTWRQFDANGDPLIGSDGRGIGIMQVTTIPAGVDAERLKTDIDYNIAVGADILVTKWGYAPSVFPVIGDGDPRCYENWFFAVWAYNGWKGGNPYPYQIWGHIADGRGLWTGLAVTPVPAAWLVSGFPVPPVATPQPRALVEPHAAAQARAERAARAEEGRGRRPVHRLRHALAQAPGRRALRRAAPLALERLAAGCSAARSSRPTATPATPPAGRPPSRSPRPAAGSSSPRRSPTPTTPPPPRTASSRSYRSAAVGRSRL